MVSSGDEFASYDQSPHKDDSSTAKPVAGPSKPSKRKKAGAPSSDSADRRANAVDTIAISSDDGVRPMNGRRRKATGATAPDAPNGRAVSSKGKGNATATAKRKKFADANDVDMVEETTVETEEDGALSRREKAKPVAGNGKGKNHDRLQQQIERLRKQLEDVSHQRDNMSGQLQELFQLRHTEPEQQLVEQKAQYEARLKAQDDTVQELQGSLSRVDDLSRSGGTTSLHFLTRETAEEEKQDVQREVSKLRRSIKEKDGVIADKDVKIRDLDETIKVLRADLKTEIENTKTLTSRNQPSSASKQPPKSGDAKNALAIRLYEELTNLLITNVKHEPGQYKEDDAIYTCVQTTPTGISLNFTLKFFKDAEDGVTPSSAKRTGRTVDKVIYNPLLLEKETEEFITQLGFLASPFIFQKQQLAVFTSTLLKYLEGDNEDNQSSGEHMEVEDDG